ncbi:MAG: glutamine synthetase family protein [Acidimicrobiales bacterium]
MTITAGETGRNNLADDAGIDTAERRERIAEVLAEVASLELHSIRFAFVDQHGMLRGKTLRADLLPSIMNNGVGMTSALLMKDTGQKNVYPVWSEGSGVGEQAMTGAGDIVMLPDPSTFRALGWVGGTGWLLCDLFTPDAKPVEFSTRRLCVAAEQSLTDRGYRFQAGLEIEFHLYRLNDSNLSVSDTRSVVDRLDLSHTHLGWVYLGEGRQDTIEPFLEVLRCELTTIGLAPRSMEIELGPSQVELTFSPTGGLTAADQAVLLRSAVKQIAQRQGLHATFMGRPNIADSFSSGWHLHQSLLDADSGVNLLMPSSCDSPVSALGSHYVAGLLEHAPSSCLLTTPTITGYKRYRANSLAPDRVAWGKENRGAMLRVVGGCGDPATRIENRIGDSAANPYLYLASQMLSGLAGIKAATEPPALTNSPYDEAAGPLLPRNLEQAIQAFDASEIYREMLGNSFVDYLVTIKQHEWNRFMATVTDWEHREYFELF